MIWLENPPRRHPPDQICSRGYDYTNPLSKNIPYNPFIWADIVLMFSLCSTPDSFHGATISYNDQSTNVQCHIWTSFDSERGVSECGICVLVYHIVACSSTWSSHIVIVWWPYSFSFTCTWVSKYGGVINTPTYPLFSPGPHEEVHWAILLLRICFLFIPLSRI